MTRDQIREVCFIPLHSPHLLGYGATILSGREIGIREVCFISDHRWHLVKLDIILLAREWIKSGFISLYCPHLLGHYVTILPAEGRRIREVSFIPQHGPHCRYIACVGDRNQDVCAIPLHYPHILGYGTTKLSHPVAGIREVCFIPLHHPHLLGYKRYFMGKDRVGWVRNRRRLFYTTTSTTPTPTWHYDKTATQWLGGAALEPSACLMNNAQHSPNNCLLQHALASAPVQVLHYTDLLWAITAIFGWLLAFYALATSKVISGWVLTCDSAAPLGNQTRWNHNPISHTFTLSWHWVNQSLSDPINAKRQARKWQASIL